MGRIYPTLHYTEIRVDQNNLTSKG